MSIANPCQNCPQKIGLIYIGAHEGTAIDDPRDTLITQLQKENVELKEKLNRAKDRMKKGVLLGEYMPDVFDETIKILKGE